MARIIAATGAMIGVLFVVSLTTFAIQAALPGSAADIRVGERLDLSPEQRDKLVELVRRDLGLDRPIVIQYWAWLTHALKLDFGVAENGQSVREVIAPRIGPTLELTIVTMAISFPIAVLLAIVAVRRGGRVATVVDTLTLGVWVVPTFWMAILLVLLLAVWLPVVPASGYVSWHEDAVGHGKALLMPVVALGLPIIAVQYQFLAQGMREAYRHQYVKTAMAKGLSETTVLYRHVLPNALLPSLTLLGIQFGHLIGGVVVIERIFAWPGVGGLLLGSIDRQDFSVMIACVLAIAAAYVLFSTVIEIAYGLADPRVRRS